MTITDLTVGAASLGLNLPVTPGTPSGLAVGDLVLIFSAIRNSGVGVANCPTGWTPLIAGANNVQLCGRFWETGDVMPSMTFTGGVATADTYSRALKVRGAGLDTLTELAATLQSNVSAQNIAYPALDVTGADQLLLMALWKQDDATSIATPAGWTSQGLTNSTFGDDQLVQLYTQLQTTETDIVAGSAVVTGGVAAISKAVLLAVKPAPTVTVTEVNLYPPRTQITVNGLTLDDDVQVYRSVAGVRTLVRGGDLSGATDPAFVVVDAEIPFDIPVSYDVVVNNSATYSSAAVSYQLGSPKTILSDAINGVASEFVIVAWDEKAYDRQASVFKVGGRNVVVTGDLGQFEATLEIFFEAYSSTEAFKALMRQATEGVLQLRSAEAQYEGVDCYLAILSARERRFSQDGSDPRRTWVLEVAEVESWSEGLISKAFTYADVTAFYASAGGTYATLLSDHATYLAVKTADFS